MKKWFLFIPLFVLLLLAGGAGTVMYVLKTLPDVEQIKGCMKTSMFGVNLCPSSSRYVRVSDVSDLMVQALVVTEDAAFFGHDGFDWDEIKKSLETNMSRGQIARGGSTLTQQLAKNVFLTPDKTITRKIKEAILAYRIERILSKKQILERYLNVVEFGPGIYGIRAAAQHYFEKSPSQLNLLESAYLTHLLPNPKVYSSGFRKGSLTAFSRQRVMTISRTLLFYKRISATQLSAANSLLNRFPWRDLTEDEKAWLRGEISLGEEMIQAGGQPSESGERGLFEPAPVNDGGTRAALPEGSEVPEVPLPEPEDSTFDDGPGG